MYFALRSYRDSLVASLAKSNKKTLSDDDYLANVQLGVTEGFGPPELDNAPTNVLKLKDDVVLQLEGNNNDYEDLMFLHESLYKVNAFLFELVKNHDHTDGTADAITNFLDV